MRKSLDEKDQEIQDIKSKYDTLEAAVKEIKKHNNTFEERLADIIQQNSTFLNESIAVLDKSTRAAEIPKFECENCNFVTESERGLKVHLKRKHDDLAEKEFPKVCDFCDHESFSEEIMRRHLKEHTYTNLKYKCGDCEFLAEDEFSLDIHAGRVHSGNYECAICGFSGKDIGELEMHLHTCEKFTCTYCGQTFKNITDVKSHLTIKHPKHIKQTTIKHIQMDRKNSDKAAHKEFRGSYFF